jgi:hypothetical protein
VIDRLERGAYGACGIAFPGGEWNNGIVPIDFDIYQDEECETRWRRECEAAGIPPDDFVTAITPGKKVPGQPRRGGLHRYVRDVRGTLGNSTGDMPKSLDIRGKGYVVLPPSPHPDGGTYA